MKTVMDHGHWTLLSVSQQTHSVPKELYDKGNSHMPDELNVDELKIPNIPYEDLKKCCNG